MDIKRAAFFEVHGDSKKVGLEKVAQDAFSKSISLPEVDTQTGTTPPE